MNCEQSSWLSFIGHVNRERQKEPEQVVLAVKEAVLYRAPDDHEDGHQYNERPGNEKGFGWLTHLQCLLFR